MLIKTHHSLSLDRFSATQDGWPAITQVTESKPKETHGIPEVAASTVAVAMGRTTKGDSQEPLKLTGREAHPDGSLELLYERA